jgi:hypothetical protein
VTETLGIIPAVEVTFGRKEKEKRALHLLKAMAMFLDILTLCYTCGVNARAGLSPCARKGSRNFISLIFFIALAFPMALWTMERTL